MQSLSILMSLIISVVTILNVNGKPSPPTDLSENSRTTNGSKQEVLKVYVIEIDFLSNNESLKNSSSQNETANNFVIIMGKDVSEKGSLQNEDLIQLITDNKNKKRNKRSPKSALRKIITSGSQMQRCVLKDERRAKINSNPQREDMNSQPRTPYVKSYGGSRNMNNYNIHSSNSINYQVYNQENTFEGNNENMDEYLDQSSTGIEDNIRSNNSINYQVYNQENTFKGNDENKDEYSDQSSTGIDDNEYESEYSGDYN